jgi:hypothetical protein
LDNLDIIIYIFPIISYVIINITDSFQVKPKSCFYEMREVIREFLEFRVVRVAVARVVGFQLRI